MATESSQALQPLGDPQPQALQRIEDQPTNLLHAIITLSQNPQFDVEKFDRLCQMQERLEAREAKKEYIAAVARIQAELPQVVRTGMVKGKGGVDRFPYAPLEDLDEITRPLMARETMTFDVTEEEAKGNDRRYAGTLSHAGGHSETKYITLPLDVNEFRSGCQSAGSTAAYARRNLLKMFFNIVERKEDTDGTGPAFITAEQVKDVETMLQVTNSDKAKFLKLIAGTDSIESIPARDYQRVMTNLQEKQRLQNK